MVNLLFGYSRGLHRNTSKIEVSGARKQVVRTLCQRSYAADVTDATGERSRISRYNSSIMLIVCRALIPITV